ncbi:PH domain-containing protein [Marilutibacter alkalisoli]|uniref:Bacterial Pleckstrin homology domain-containing protein n=1 Tax=Marilutibacter alkalisoli TaxID=2591633 RepID=A0A514BRN0_9GAMM|nr:PH domain-containing protein [Lysobacter alkalisoli]QDH69669.1 hypothetical protein FKV23_05855 [Lysobacter alkalisoli]
MKRTNMPAQEFPLAPLRRIAWLTLILPAVAVVIGTLLLPQKQATPAPAWLVTPFFIALLMTGLLLALRRRRIAIEGRELVVAATLYTKRVSIDALDLGKARIVDLAEHTEYKPMLKTNGYALPGFSAGHFRLRNRAKAFCLLTRRERVLLLPRRDGKLILLSPERPQELLSQLRGLAAAIVPH